MVCLAEYEVGGDETIRIEVEEIETGFVPSSLGFDILKTDKKFEDIISNLDSSLNILYDKIRNVKHKPKDVSVEFGLKITGNCQAFITSAGMAAQFKITVTWEGIT
ncbi:MAG: hypothetical protein A4E44_00294 [Methanosaeta sp. PtaB.Bin018]|jgi:hypothetical protein|nr:hypothetical protein [Methanothrix sp.]OPX76888.1 MAG: hypothetical protein A4E44_00294 [Methanosaeta sp. PtaB.Bin018]OPY45019.1 MAG: hypothetical protein A4E46_01350 [Methanosaeta sp. PtaU1.Bin016]